ncbi:hypothetical protein RRV45_10390 [Bacillus sp. DTU_2020_1000418_1_SI_GHA_SEK_038]|uniref:hypothetical protein n=1 Tax=Bacillus sp. DTU_2020_1000418_1_SI_GHA_SEK_038 TaxID=3077585 RepID=UPI0028E5A182|nr:hypothetical protein [Bacillus sp. DTU_2020_1000418_1_SI_GHA_SEK_038]WNS77364.1 hypothetical protein RRV45_10390 [Bacillus sp. DTU_2020_1000418_1_SI_GHA_SEK_038]
MIIKKENNEPVPNVSGSFQVVTEEQKTSLKEAKENGNLDEESLYYARVFMED